MFCSKCNSVLEKLDFTDKGIIVYGCPNPDCDRIFQQITGFLKSETITLVPGSFRHFNGDTGSAIMSSEQILKRALEADKTQEAMQVNYLKIKIISDLQNPEISGNTWLRFTDFLKDLPGRAEIARDSNQRDYHGHR